MAPIDAIKFVLIMGQQSSRDLQPLTTCRVSAWCSRTTGRYWLIQCLEVKIPFLLEKYFLLFICSWNNTKFSAELAAKLSPDNGIIRASVELLSTSDADRPRGVKQTSQDPPDQDSPEGSSKEDPLAEESTSGQSDAKRPKLRTTEEKEDAMLPDLKVVPGNLICVPKVGLDCCEFIQFGMRMTIICECSDHSGLHNRFYNSVFKFCMIVFCRFTWHLFLLFLKQNNIYFVLGTSMRFTEIPCDKYPPGSTPEEITKHYLDQSYTLELMIAQHVEYVSVFVSSCRYLLIPKLWIMTWQLWNSVHFTTVNNVDLNLP